MNETGRMGESLGSAGALFLATGTLVCCALPILLVTIGFGSVVATLTSAAPWLVALSKFKAWMFAGSGGVLLAAMWMVYRPGRICPADPVLAHHCQTVDRINRIVLWSASALWIVGLFAAYAWLPFLQAWETQK